MVGESAQGILVALIAVLAAVLLWTYWKLDRLLRTSAEQALQLAEARVATRFAMEALACKNIQLSRAEHLIDLQRRAQVDIERLFLRVLRELDPDLAAALARDFARVNAHLGMHRAMAPHQPSQPQPNGGRAGG